MAEATAEGPRSIARIVLAILIGLLGLWLLIFGAELLILGGSTYYVIAGIAMLATTVLLVRGNALALWVYAALLIGTVIWALAEVGLDFWQLAPRGDLLVPIGILLLIPWFTRGVSRPVRMTRGAGMALAIAILVSILVLIVAVTRNPHDMPGSLPDRTSPPVYYPAAKGDWPAYAGTWAGLKWSPLTQITAANVNKLQVAWHIKTGDTKRAGDPVEITYEATPIKVGDTLYLCTPHDIILALDPLTGHEKWRFDPKVHVTGTQHMTCRGVSYFDSAAALGAPPGPPRPSPDCTTRVFVATNDARLIAVDALTGKPCAGFGKGGEINLWPGMPAYHQGWYQFTSAPLVTRGLVVLAGSIYDDMSKWMPSGVIRAFDARTGRLVWNFDPGNPNDTAPIKPGQRYSWSSPNSWSTATADEKLGMIYFPMGMGAVDQYGVNRPATTEKFATSVLALDTATGKVRWVFQTVHHDLWDMDVPTQPALLDLPVPGRGMVPALVQSTKTGNIFVLDRRTGKPIIPVLEQKVPQGGMPGDHISPTQPLSALTLLPPIVRESDMWGATMLDQLLCRVRFKQARYEGWFTPPTLKPTIVFPGNFGVMDWGGLAIDPVRKIAFAHPNYMAFVDQLTTRKAHAQNKGSEQGYNPNTGAPFAVYLNPFLSKLGLPCQAPPWGYVAGLDLATGKIRWMHKNGTIQDESPVPLPLKLGVPSLGPPMVTAAGLAFMSSTLDYYARAYDMANGRELWRARLPAGAQSGPMTYLGRDGRQYLIVVAGGHGSLGTKLGDDVIAYALPRRG
ncbi:MAG TPA: membrane-bound PQQ-dependent dehydrogenase, glucose/quinate/shikimate family [Sphingomicrobium sp.]|nr:membrane-bound PQQ-dependent dehydrogenase, glucose/quinate/shikimate family [Sphingomicrobium sp.]